MKNYLVLILVLLNSSGFGAFIAVDMDVRLSYQSLEMACVMTGVDPAERVSLTGRIENSKIVEAMFKNLEASGTFTFPENAKIDGRSISFLAEELKDIVVSQDALGDYYISSLRLSARLINWLVFHVDIGPSPIACRPLQPLATLGPWGSTFVFPQSTATDYVTAIQRFSGTLLDGSPYNLKLGFTERQTNQ